MREAIATLAGLVTLLAAAPAGGQVPGVPLPPIGPPGSPPPQEPPPPEQQPPPQNEPRSPQPAGSPPTGSVTVSVDPAHTGYVDDPNLVPPLRARWSRRFHSPVRNVLAAEGRLYTLARDRGVFALRALDPLTGRDIWVRKIPSSQGLAYDGGLLFAVGLSVVRAFSAKDGSPIWEHKLNTSTESFLGAPVASGGVVYAAVGTNLIALRQSDGERLWLGSGNGTENTPAIDADRAYLAYACAEVIALKLADGMAAWRHPGRCSGGGGSTPSLFGPNLYVPELGLVIDAASGTEKGKFPGDETPVFARGVGVFLRRGHFTAVEMATGKVLWRYRGQRQPSGSSPGETIVGVGHSVYRLMGGNGLYALALETGGKQWSTRVPSSFGRDDNGYLDGEIGVAPGLLLVPGGRTLTAYESVFRPAGGAVAAGPANSDIEYLRRNLVAGVLGRDLRTPGKRVRLEVDERPFGRFQPRASTRMAPDGFFSFRVRTRVNTRVRVRSGGVVSAPRTIYTYPRIGYKVRRVGTNVIRVGISTRTPRSVRLGGRRASLYIFRVKSHRLERLGTTTLRAGGRGRAAGSVTFRALRHVGRHDSLTTCVKGQLRLGLGRPTRFTRRCGARRIRL